MNTNKETNKGELSGKRALVTGGTKGIGEAIVRSLRAAGASVMTTARSMPQDLESPEFFFQADISTTDGAEKIVKEVHARFGGLDILINNVGSSYAPNGGVM